MESLDVRLAARSRRAYELGRVLAALPTAALAAPLTAVSCLFCGRPAESLACGALLALLIVVFLWRGGGLARGVRPGLLAGLPGVLLPIGLQCTAHPCTPAACGLLSTLCVTAGVTGGLVLGILGASRRSGLLSFALSAGSSALLSASLGCLILGSGGLAGLTAGMFAASAPLLLLSRLRA